MNWRITDCLSAEQYRYMEQKYQNAFLTEVALNERYNEHEFRIRYFCSFDDDDMLEDIVAFYIIGKYAVVVNWLVEVLPTLAEMVEKGIFEQFADVKCIVWQKLLNVIDSPNSFSYVENADMCVLLPSTRELYNEMLSSNSRKIYVKKTHRVERDLDEMVVNLPADESNIYLVDILAQWKQNQLLQRGEKSMVDVNFVKKALLSMGYVSYIMAEGKPICVCLFYKVGTHIFFEQTAYDENFSRYYSPGRVLTYQSILKFIDQGITHFHFLWKGTDYKKHYSANEIPVYTTYSYNKKSCLFYRDYMMKKCRLFLRKIANTPRGHAFRQWVNKTLYGRAV